MSEMKCGRAPRCTIAESRVNGYCSVECECMAEVEEERDDWRAKLHAFARAVGVSFPDALMTENDVEAWRVHGAAIAHFEEQMRAEVKRLRAQIEAFASAARSTHCGAGGFHAAPRNWPQCPLCAMIVAVEDAAALTDTNAGEGK